MKSFQCEISAIDDFDSAVLSVTPEELASHGFEMGDTVDMDFSNGFSVEDVPYYNGYYVGIGEPVLVAYPRYKYPTMNYNCAKFSEKTNVRAGDSVIIRMHTKAGKKEVMDFRGVVYSYDPKDYASLDQFANAREVRVGRIAPGKLFRCASPFDHRMNRPEAVSEFLERHGVCTTLSISESKESLRERYAEMPPYSRKLYESGHVIPFALGSGYFSEDFKSTIAAGLVMALDHPLPWAVHCLEGKDRTGFVLALLESLMDAGYQEIVDDYMETYHNYYGITEQSDPFRYHGFKTTFIDEYLRIFAGISGEACDLTSLSFCNGAADYLRAAGMTDEQITRLKQLLS